MASKRPTYSSQSTIFCWTGVATVTVGGGGAGCSFFPQAARIKTAAAAARIRDKLITPFRSLSIGESAPHLIAVHDKSTTVDIVVAKNCENHAR
jgi:hypothetical protein